MVLVGEPETLHPLYASSRAAQDVLGALFVGCIGQDEMGAPVALGCESVPTLENGGARLVGEGEDQHLDVLFRIRQGWRWTDGQPVTAQDALYSWQLIMSPEAQLRDALTQKVYAMSAADERTVVVSFMSAAQARAAAAGKLRGDVPFEYFSQRGDYARYAEQAVPLGDVNYWAALRWLPAHVLKDIPAREQLQSGFARKPVGDGAFELSAWNAGKDLTLRRSTQPFVSPGKQAQGNILQINVQFAPDEASAVQGLQSGAAQLSSPLESVGAITGGLTITPVVAPLVEQIVLNSSRFPFDDVKVRQALQVALDSRAIISDPSTGSAAAARVLSPAGLFHGSDASALQVKHDLARAQALLSEAGWICTARPCVKPVAQKDGTVVTQTLTFTLVTNERNPRNALSQVIQKQLGAAGFAVDLQIVHGLGKASRLFAPFEQGGLLLTRNFDAALYQAPALSSLSGVFDCASIPTEAAPWTTQGNVFGYCDAATDALIAVAENSANTISTAVLSKDVNDALKGVTDQALFAPLYSPLWALPVRDVGGLRYAGVGSLMWNAWDWQQLAQR
jgi:ABC-type transport system substrate-binding protein